MGPAVTVEVPETQGPPPPAPSTRAEVAPVVRLERLEQVAPVVRLARLVQVAPVARLERLEPETRGLTPQARS